MKLPKVTLEEEIEILCDTIDSNAPQAMRVAARDRLVEIREQQATAGSPLVKPDREAVKEAALKLRAQAKAAGLFDGSGNKSGGAA
ncbi:hypothetical protein [Methylobacterium pseudosasicola]|uniref:Uncharacterized protein n=1 Tax=Methylobacterium pseudosasicola TaxID=582667 RepID=A0A1I4U074_9HYPH|nr:hypothetical protein [Methylobacterium pseudosasicola]SFM82251.1 hypothetical protein SAMN05192568_10617 [Methylobacterium pseudosasicola]